MFEVKFTRGIGTGAVDLGWGAGAHAVAAQALEATVHRCPWLDGDLEDRWFQEVREVRTKPGEAKRRPGEARLLLAEGEGCQEEQEEVRLHVFQLLN